MLRTGMQGLRGGAAESDSLRLLLAGVLVIGTAALVLYLRLWRPFIWIWFAILAVCIPNAVRASSEGGRRVFLIGSSLALVLGVLEILFTTLNQFRTGGIEAVGTYTEGGYFEFDSELGYAPRPGTRVTSRKMRGRDILYDVAYTISEHGIRHTRGNPSGDTWLFMGCSLMFGEGVNDDATLPAFFSAELGYRANVVNIGFHGYGPHQMLRSLEVDRPRSLIGGVLRQVIYEGISDHVRRAAGRDGWDLYGPSYTLGPDGVSFNGPFHGRVMGFTLQVLKRSDFLQFVLDQTLFRPGIRDEDIQRYVRILERMSLLAAENYGSGLTLIYWDDDSELSGRILARLRSTALSLILVSEVIPREEWPRLAIPGDGHPTPEANRRLANMLAARFGERTSAGRGGDASDPP